MLGSFLTPYADGAKIGVDTRPWHDTHAASLRSKPLSCRRREWTQCESTAYDWSQVRFRGDCFQARDCLGI